MKRIIYLFLMLFCINSLSLIAQNTHYQQPKDKTYLGVSANILHPSKAKKLNISPAYGSYITRVYENTAAEKMGLKAFDYIYAINGERLDKDNTLSDRIRQYAIGDKVEVSFIRDEKKRSKKVALGNKADRIKTNRTDEEDPFLGVSNRHQKLEKKQSGVPVAIIKGSTAEKMALKTGDVITKINNYPILDWHDLSAAIDAMNVGDPIEVIVYRGQELRSFEAPIGSVAEQHAFKEQEKFKEEELTQQLEEESPERISEEVNKARMEDMEIEWSDVSQAEADVMKEQKGIDMPIINNLQIDKLKLFPNPNDGLFQLRFDLVKEGYTSIRIFSAAGRLIYTNDLGVFTGSFNDQIDLTSKPAGFYFLEIRQEEQTITQKISIQRL